MCTEMADHSAVNDLRDPSDPRLLAHLRRRKLHPLGTPVEMLFALLHACYAVKHTYMPITATLHRQE